MSVRTGRFTAALRGRRRRAPCTRHRVTDAGDPETRTPLNIRRHLALAATPCLALSLLAAAPASAETTAPLWQAQMCASSDAAYDPAAMTLMDTRAVEATSSTGMKLVITSLTYDLGMGGRWCDLGAADRPGGHRHDVPRERYERRLVPVQRQLLRRQPGKRTPQVARGAPVPEPRRSQPGLDDEQHRATNDTPVGTSVIGAGSYLRHQTGRVASGHVWMDSTWYHEWALRVRSESGTTAIVTPDAAAVAAAKKVYQPNARTSGAATTRGSTRPRRSVPGRSRRRSPCRLRRPRPHGAPPGRPSG